MADRSLRAPYMTIGARGPDLQALHPVTRKVSGFSRRLRARLPATSPPG
jgi:hypothetical protein